MLVTWYYSKLYLHQDRTSCLHIIMSRCLVKTSVFQRVHSNKPHTDLFLVLLFDAVVLLALLSKTSHWHFYRGVTQRNNATWCNFAI